MSKTDSSNFRKGYIRGILSGMTWGFDTTLLAVALTISPFYNDPSLLLGGTFICCLIHILFETITMSVVVARTGRFREVAKTFGSKAGLICMAGAICGGPLAMTCFLLAIEANGAALTTTVTATYPLIGAVMAMFILRERITPQMWIGMMLCVLGILYSGMFIPNTDNSGISIGIILAVATAIGWGFEGVACRYVVGKCDIHPKVALMIREITCLVAYALIAPIFLGGYDHATASIAELLIHWKAFAVVAIASLFGAYSMYLWYSSIKDVGATRGLCLNVTYSVWTIIFGCILFLRFPDLTSITGAIITIAGVVLALWRRDLSLSSSFNTGYDFDDSNNLSKD